MTALSALAASLPALILVIVRLGGVAIFAPAISSAVVPVRVRVAVAILLGLAIFPVLASRGVFAADLPAQLELFSLGPLVAMEITFGAVIGFFAMLPLVAAQTSGLIMGQQMGLGFAQLFNPGFDEENDIIGQVFFLFALAAFLMIGGLEHVTLAVMHSFDYLPLGGFTVDGGLLTLLSGLLLAAFELALRIAAPLLALVFLETVAMAFVAKTVPQLNILSLGFPIRILAGLSILYVGITIMNDVLLEGMGAMLNDIHVWVMEGRE